MCLATLFSPSATMFMRSKFVCRRPHGSTEEWAICVSSTTPGPSAVLASDRISAIVRLAIDTLRQNENFLAAVG